MRSTSKVGLRLFTDNIRYDPRIDIEIQAATIIGRCGGFASQIFDTGGLKSRQTTAPPQIAPKLRANFREIVRCDAKFRQIV